MVFEIIVTLFAELGRLFEQLCFLAQQPGLFFAQIVEEFFELLVIHLLGGCFARAIGGRQIHFDQFRSLLLSLLAILLFCAAGRDFDVVVDDGQFAALILKRVGHGVELSLDLRDLLVDLGDFAV